MKRKGISAFEGGIFDTIALILILVFLAVGIILIVTLSKGEESGLTSRLVDIGNILIGSSLNPVPS